MTESASEKLPSRGEGAHPPEALGSLSSEWEAYAAGIGTARTLSEMTSEEEVLQVRLTGIVKHLVSTVSPAAIISALAAPTQVSSLLRVIDAWVQEHSELLALDPTASRQARLARARKGLLERAGGAYTTAEVADLLSTTPAAIRKRIQRKTLLSYRTPSGEHRLPRAQFADGRPIEGLDKVLQAMHVEDGWMRVQLFMDDDVIGALKEGRVEDAVRAVRSYLAPEEDANE